MRRFAWIFPIGLAAALPAAGEETQFVLRDIAETGDPAPGLAGRTLGAVQRPMVAADGTFLFASEITGGALPASIHDTAIFAGPASAPALVVHAGDAAPGAPGRLFADVMPGTIVLRADARVAFSAELDDPDTAHDGGIWAGLGGNLALVAREGDTAPGTTAVYANGSVDRFFQDTLHLAMNDAGAVAFRAKLSGAGVTSANNEALFAGLPGAIALVARTGAVAPDAGGEKFRNDGFESFSSPAMTASGKILFRGHLTGAVADGLWYGDPAAPSLVVHTGMAVSGAGIPSNSTLIGLGAERPVVNDAGTLLFDGPAFSGSSLVQALWLGPPSALVPIAAAGVAAPTDSKGATFNGLFAQKRLNASGQVVFRALLSTGADYGIYAWDGAVLRRLARSGDQAVGMPDGEKFSATPSENVFLSNDGKVLIRDITTPGGLQGVWLGDVATGELQLVARSGVTPTVAGRTARLQIDATIYSGYDTAGSPVAGASSPIGEGGVYAIAQQFVDGHIAVLTKPGGTAACGDLAACIAALRSKLPDPASAPDTKSAKVAKKLAKFLGSADKAAAAAAALAGTKQAKKYAAARKALEKLVAAAQVADAKARLAAVLAEIEAAVAAAESAIP